MTRGWCATCGGTGEVRHRLYGRSTCPEPTEECRDCGGTGGEPPWPDEDAAVIDAMVDEGRGL